MYINAIYVNCIYIYKLQYIVTCCKYNIVISTNKPKDSSDAVMYFDIEKCNHLDTYDIYDTFIIRDSFAKYIFNRQQLRYYPNNSNIQ